MAYCRFELCCDYGLGCFSELLLADIQRLSVAAVVFLYQITVFYNKTQQHHFWNFILMTQCKLCTRAVAAEVVVDKDRSLMWPMSYLQTPGRNGVLPHVSGVPPPEIAVPPPTVVVPLPGNDVASPIGGK